VEYDETEKNNYQYIVCEIDERGTGVSRDSLMEILHAENIMARRYFYPGCHRMEPYRSFNPSSWQMLPHTERLVKQVIQLPTGTAIREEEIFKICGIISFVIHNSRELQDKMKSRDRR
jgi:dTDP-4-amino-4,6-dideoxygalactose transaminase